MASPSVPPVGAGESRARWYRMTVLKALPAWCSSRYAASGPCPVRIDQLLDLAEVSACDPPGNPASRENWPFLPFFGG